MTERNQPKEKPAPKARPNGRLAGGLKLPMLRTVEAIVRQGTLVKAAAELGVSQPALTRTLREAEWLAGARLFERMPRGMEPTEAGLRFARAARRILAEIARLGDELEALAGAKLDTVSIGVLPVAAVGIMPRVLTALRREHPGLHVRIRQDITDNLLPLLASGDIDLIVGRLYPPRRPDDFERLPLWDEPLSVFARAGHPLLSQAGADAAALGQYGLVLPATAQRVSDDIDQFLASLGLSATGAMRANSHALIREVMHESDMLTVMPRPMMMGDLARGTVRVVPLPQAGMHRRAGVVLPSGRQLPPAVRTFLATLIAELSGLAAADVIVIDPETL